MSTARYPSLEKKSVFVTGGATGIGAALVEAFWQQGAEVAFVDIDEENGMALCDRLEEEDGRRPWFSTVDVTEATSLTEAIEAAARANGTITVLVNNVANDNRQLAADITPDDWRACLAVNLDAAFFATQAVLPGMQASGGGSVIIMSSINAIQSPASMPGYVTAKAGLVGMAKALARDEGKHRIRVNALLPGWVVTERQLDKWLTPEAEADWMKQVALPDRLMPDDVASLALFLAADDSAMITGQSFVVDGGRL